MLRSLGPSTHPPQPAWRTSTTTPAGVDPKLITDLASCRYLATATNVLLIGARGR